VTNRDVVRSFLHRKPCKSKSLWTNGDTLVSYWTEIAVWCGERVRISLPEVSVTTARHASLLKDIMVREGVSPERS
jgi:hypothetical protein